MEWRDIEPRKIPPDIRLRFLKESVSHRPHDGERHAELGLSLWELVMDGDAVAAFERAESISSGNFRDFARFAMCYCRLGRPDAALQVCDRGKEVLPDRSDIHTVRGMALRMLGRHADAREAFLRAVALSPDAFEAVECLFLALAADRDGAGLLSLSEELPSAYTNSTVVRGYRAIGLSLAGRRDEARSLVDLERYPLRVGFEPPAEFGSIEQFNAQLTEEILNNPGVYRVSVLEYRRTDHLAIMGARAFPVLAKFLRDAIERYLAEFARRGLDAVLPAPPRAGILCAAGNIVRGGEVHRVHLHKFGYVSGVYHVAVPPAETSADDQAGALVLGSCDGIIDDYIPCWGRRDIRPIPGVATLFPSHIFHTVNPTRSEHLRIAVPFDLCIAQA
jgi:hypothetical protein